MVRHTKHTQRKKKMKKIYSTPTITTLFLAVEQGIMAGSAHSTERNNTTGSGDSTTPSGTVEKYDGSEEVYQRSFGNIGGWDNDWD